jgi:DNA-binding NtrC family response regulator
MSKAKVMIVDDEVEFACTLAERLLLRGYDMHVVTSPLDTMQQLEEIRPEILLLDLRMPGISGVEILTSVRRIFPETKVILMTGQMDLEQTIDGLRLDSFQHIIKPVNISALIEKMDSLLTSHD